MPRILPPLPVEQILEWADAHHAATGVWSGDNSGPVTGQPDEVGSRIAACLLRGIRGLPGV
jgi:hypothetical protein